MLALLGEAPAQPGNQAARAFCGSFPRPDQQSHCLQHREGLVSKAVVRQELKVEDKTGERMRWQAGKGQNGSQCVCVHLVGGS